MTLAYTKRIGFWTWKTDVRAQKLDEWLLETFKMIIAGFQIIDKLGRVWFFQEIFLLTNTNIEKILGMPFLILNNTNVQFNKRELTWKSYTTAEALLTTQRVELIDKKEFAKVTLDKNIETFMVYVNFLSQGLRMTIHLAKKVQIFLLIVKKISILAKYLDFANVFLEKSANIFLEQIGANEHAIQLE